MRLSAATPPERVALCVVPCNSRTTWTTRSVSSRRGQAIAAQSPAPPGTYGYDPGFREPSTASYDPARAKALLDIYGYLDRDGDGWREPARRLSALCSRWSSADPIRSTAQYNENWLKSLDRDRRPHALRTLAVAGAHEGSTRRQAADVVPSAARPPTPDAQGRCSRHMYSKSIGQENLARFGFAPEFRCDLPSHERPAERARARGGCSKEASKDRRAAWISLTRFHAHRIYNDFSWPWIAGYRQPFFQGPVVSLRRGSTANAAPERWALGRTRPRAMPEPHILSLCTAGCARSAGLPSTRRRSQAMTASGTGRSTRSSDFWQSIWDCFGFASPTPHGGARRRVMPGAKWFDGARLNYAAEVFRSVRRVAGGRRSSSATNAATIPDVSWSELEARVAALAASLRAPASRPATASSRTCRTCPRRSSRSSRSRRSARSGRSARRTWGRSACSTASARSSRSRCSPATAIATAARSTSVATPSRGCRRAADGAHRRRGADRRSRRPPRRRLAGPPAGARRALRRLGGLRRRRRRVAGATLDAASRCRSTIRCGSSTRAARPARRRRSCTATAARRSSG